MKKIIIVICVILCFIFLLAALLQAWQYAIWYNESFGSMVSQIYTYTRAQSQILFLKTYDTFSEAKSAIKSEPDTLLFVQTDYFEIVPLANGGELFIVKEKSGWKIENGFQFCRGHCGINTRNKNHEFIARRVQNQWYIWITFFDDQPHVCYSDRERYIPYTYNYCGSGPVHQLVAISIGADEEPFSIYIDGDSYELQDHEWTPSFENALD